MGTRVMYVVETNFSVVVCPKKLHKEVCYGMVCRIVPINKSSIKLVCGTQLTIIIPKSEQNQCKKRLDFYCPSIRFQA